MKLINYVLLVIAIIVMLACAAIKVGAMDINNPPYSVNYIKEVNGELLYPKIIPIGVWDMNTNSTCNVAHGLGANWKKIVDIQIKIFNDGDTQHYYTNQMFDGADPGLVGAGVGYVNSTDIHLYRRTGGTFQTLSFNDAVMNRGEVILWFRQ